MIVQGENTEAESQAERHRYVSTHTNYTPIHIRTHTLTPTHNDNGKER